MIGYSGTKKKGFSQSVKFHCENANTKTLQMFAKSPQRWANSAITDEDAHATKEYVVKNQIFLVIHGSYLVNMAKPTEKSINCAVDDMIQAYRLGAVGAIFHMGCACGMSKTDCYAGMLEFITCVLEKTNHTETKFILETSAGEGSESCSDIRELAEFYGLLRTLEQYDRIRFCVDTAHIFAAGYDVSTQIGSQEFIDQWDGLIGWDLVTTIHLNDSKTACQSCVDSHQDIGKGAITANGIEGLRHLVRFFAEKQIPMVLETPCGTLDKPTEIEMVRGWIMDD